MRPIICASLILSLVACGEDKKARYETWDEAEKAGAIERGWVLHFIPKSARDIREVHNLDTNAQMLRFKVPPADGRAMLARLPAISAKDKAAATDMSKGLGLAGAWASRLVCSRPLDGVLFVNQDGHAVLKTPAPWADDDCSRIEICSSNAPYDDSKYERWAARAKEAGCDGTD